MIFILQGHSGLPVLLVNWLSEYWDRRAGNNALNFVRTILRPGATENAGVENAIRAKMQGWKMQKASWKAEPRLYSRMGYIYLSLENAGASSIEYVSRHNRWAYTLSRHNMVSICGLQLSVEGIGGLNFP